MKDEEFNRRMEYLDYGAPGFTTRIKNALFKRKVFIDYSNNLSGMLRVCREQGWNVTLHVKGNMCQATVLVHPKGFRWAVFPYKEATPEKALKGALIGVLKHRKYAKSEVDVDYVEHEV